MKKTLIIATAVLLIISCNNSSETVTQDADTGISKSNPVTVDTAKARQELNAVADDLHRLFKKKDLGFMDKYLAKDGLYLGTDPDEVWTFDQFRTYMERGFSDTAARISDYSISRRDITMHGATAVVIDQYMFPELSNKVMVRTIGHARYDSGKWIFDMYSWNMIPKNEDLPKISRSL
jgi:hypothetical protein